MRGAKIFLLNVVCLATVVLSPASSVFAQDQPKTDIKNLIESKKYIFKAQTVTPAAGRTRQLNSEYTVKVSGDSVIADLPYFGRAYSAPIGTTGGINFTSSSFDYKALVDKKQRWQITIKPKDMNEVQELSFTVFENGNADLRVISTNRQTIMFRGYITEK